MLQSTQPHPHAIPSNNLDPGLKDADLLARFIEGRDQSAFESLVRAHGPLVYGVCLRILGNHHDAEDAFQATFLILARKATSIVRRGMPANWLFQVAHRSALKVRTAVSKRRQREKQMAELPEIGESPTCDWSELAPVLDDAIHSLPHKYQVAVVLCDLEGKTRKDAARQLGWPEGTLVTRLTKAREILANRLTRQGIVLSTGALALLLSQNAASAAVPGALVAATTQAATAAISLQATSAALTSGKGVALVKGALKTSLLAKGVTAATLAGVVAVAGLTIQTTPPETRKEAEPAPRAEQHLPPQIQQALEENARQLSPIFVSYSMELKSELPVDETAKRLNMPANERWLFSKTACRTAWQGHSFYHAMSPRLPKGEADNIPVDIEASIVGDVQSQKHRRQQEGAARLIRSRIDKSTPVGLEFSILYFGAAAFLSLDWDPGDTIQLQVESDLLRSLKNMGKLLSIEDVLLEGRPHVRITLETENLIRRRAEAEALRLEARDTRSPDSPEMQEHLKLLKASIDEQRKMPPTRRMVFDLDPALHYAVRRAEQWYEPDVLLRRTVCSDFEQVSGRSLWLPRRCETEMHELPARPMVFHDVHVTQVLEVSQWNASPIPNEQFLLGGTTPGTVVSDFTFSGTNDSRGRPVTYTVPQRAEDLETVIAAARQEAVAAQAAPGMSVPTNTATDGSATGAGSTDRRGAAPLPESGSVEAPSRFRTTTILVAVNGLFLAGALGYFLYKRWRTGGGS